MIDGKFYIRDSSLNINASLEVNNEIYKITTVESIVYTGAINTLKIENRLSNTERKIVLKDGSVFATHDNDKIDVTFKKYIQGKGFIHTLESKMSVVILSLIISIFFGFAFFKWGIPWSSKKIAYALPQETKQLITANTLEFLDKYILKESKISQIKMDEIRKHFTSSVVPLTNISEDSTYKLHFRLLKSANISLPNAFALPSGDIILTDKFVELCQSQDEMDSVLLHEIGHVVHRHTLETIIESTFVSLAVLMIIGDSNAISDIGLGVGTLFVSSNYSRGHESEADKYSFEHMLIGKIDPIAFSNIMNRMTEYMQDFSKSHSKKESKEDIFDYISSHPSTKERIIIAQQYSDCFKKGLINCN